MDQNNRRAFLRAIGGTAALSLAPRLSFVGAGRSQPAASAAPDAGAEAKDPLPTMLLGSTKRTLPRLGLGCHPISTLSSDEAGAAIVTRAITAGVRYLDTAPSYGDGKSERRIGIALQEFLKTPADGAAPSAKREDFFIATKTLMRDGGRARKQLEASLKLLGVEYVDSVQVHEVHDDVETLFGDSDVVKCLEKARDEGLIRHIGITGHRDPKWLIQAIKRYEFATALVPVNPLDVKHLSFIKDFLPVAIERKVGVIAMKVFAGGQLVTSKKLTPAEGLTYALAQKGVAIAVPGCDKSEYVDADVKAVREYKAPTPEWLAEIEKKAGDHAGKTSEWYKDEAEKK